MGMMPHGYCLLWNPVLVIIEIAGNGIIALAYFIIALVMASSYVRAYFTIDLPPSMQSPSARKIAPFRFHIWSFASFIFLCAWTHVFRILTLWWPVYWGQAVTDFLTAVVSIAVACAVLASRKHVLKLLR